jgi:hypothetical protein
MLDRNSLAGYYLIQLDWEVSPSELNFDGFHEFGPEWTPAPVRGQGPAETSLVSAGPVFLCGTYSKIFSGKEIIMKILAAVMLVVVALLPARAYARLGETLEQCTKRYGEPVRVINNRYAFKPIGFNIFITFVNGKAGEINISKIGKTGKPENFTVGEIKLLLKANSQGKKWVGMFEPSPEMNLWTRGTNKETRASYYAVTCSFHLSTKEGLASWIKDTSELVEKSKNPAAKKEVNKIVAALEKAAAERKKKLEEF